MKVKLSSSARDKILLEGRDKIFVEFYEGGCAGYRYRFSFQGTPNAKSFDCDGITVGLYGTGSDKIHGILIDHECSLMGSRFYVQKIDGVFCKCSSSVGLQKPKRSC